MAKHEKFFKDPRLPMVECRYSRSSARRFKPHMHRSFSVGAVDAGLVEYRVAEDSAKLFAGSLALINPDTLHSCNSVSGTDRSYFMLHLDVNWCLEVQQSLWRVDGFVRVSEIHIEDWPLYRHYISVLHTLMDKSCHLLLKEQLLVELASSVFMAGCQPQKERGETSTGVELLKSHLGANLKEEITLSSLAESLGVNPYTLIRRFKSETGITPYAFRTNCRVEHARKLLGEGMDIGETALECGFYDQSHLHRHFKAITTVTPKEYLVNFVQ